MNKHFLFCTVTWLCFFASMADASDGVELLQQSGVRGGVVVHLGCGDGTLRSNLRQVNSTSFTVWTRCDKRRGGPEAVAGGRTLRCCHG